jgi:cell shape-determining protein MreC
MILKFAVIVGSIIAVISIVIVALETTLKNAVDMTVVVGGIVAVITLVIGALEYSRQGAQKRAEYFSELRKRFQENPLFKELTQELDEDAPALADRPFKEKREILGFFEDIALMVNSNLIRKHVVHYMFGYYMIRCWESDNFWKTLNRNSPYWALFRNFAEDMKKFEKSFSFKIRKYRL